MKKRIISMLLTVLMVMSLFSGLTVNAHAATYNGASVVTHSGTVTYGAPAGDLTVETSYIEPSEERKDMITDVRARKL